MAETRTEVPAGQRGTPEGLRPGPPVDLRRALRVGVSLGGAVAFVSAVGMVEAFNTPRLQIVEDLTFAYAMLIGIALGLGYLAGRPPSQIEGFAPTPPGIRNVAGGFLAGAVGAGIVTLFVLFVDTVDIRGIFVNVSPVMSELLLFERGLGVGILLILAGSTALATVGGLLHLIPLQWRRPLAMSLLWVWIFGLLHPFISQMFEGAGLSFVSDALYTGTSLSFVSAGVLAAIFFGIYFVLGRGVGHARSPFRERFEAIPKSRRRWVGVALAAAVLVAAGFLPQILGSFLSEVLDLAGIFVLMALGLNIVVGFAGLLDLGYVAFFAVGAYTTAVLTSGGSPALTPELTFWAALPFVVLAAAVAGLMVGTPVLRMRGDYLAIVTLGFGEITRIMFLSDAMKGFSGGAQGITRIPDIGVGAFEVSGPQRFFYAILLFVAVATYVSYALQDSRVGRAWMAMREDEDVAEAMGVNIVRNKLTAFVIGAILAGFGGALFAVKIGSVFPHSFDIVTSITILVIIIVGGLASVPGVMLGALALIALPEILREFEEFKFLLYGGLLIFMMLNRPEGFIPSRRRAQELHEEEMSQDEWLKREQERAETAPATG